MKSSKSLTILALILVLVLSFSACGSKGASDNSAPMEAPQTEGYNSDYYEYDDGDYGFSSTAPSEGESDLQQPSPNEKIIYSGYAEIETLEFDKTLENLEKMILGSGGFIQSSDIRGNDFNTSYYGGKSYRTASYSIRIPADKFTAFTEGLAELGNIPYSSSSAENITMQYRDTAAKLEARQTEQTRLLELLAQANSVEEILLIESRLSEVRYDIESLTGQLKGWDDLVSYSTLELYISEVVLYTEGSTATLSYGTQLKEGFIRSLKGVGRFFQNFFKLFVISLPVLIVLAVIAVVVIVIIRSVRKKKALKIKAPPKDKNQNS
jgi:hypothetical protein